MSPCCNDYNNGTFYVNNRSQQWFLWIVLILAFLYFTNNGVF